VSPQQTIAHYRITIKLGEGGMGAVYRATDTKLARDVAIKILPDTFAADPDRLARFTREAQVLASLNHPNIAAIYGVEDRALVLELVEGPTLAERIAQGPIPVEEALPMVAQLIDGLEYAHEKGVVHRDLKPANVKLSSDGRVKILDFGLAKALASDTPAGDPAASPTLTMRATMAGAIMGTAAYMAPEQARGHNVDRRADIWAFGVVVYEMLTGRALFAAETISDTLAAVLRQDIEFAPVPAPFAKLLRLALARNPKERLRDIGDARFLLLDEPARVAPASSRGSAWIAGALAVLALAFAMMWWRASRPAEQSLVSLNVDLGEDAVLATRATVAVSRDGTRVAYPVKLENGRQRLAIRSLDGTQQTSLAGSEEATVPVFSPDGQWLAFFAGNSLKKIAVQGGGPVVLCDAPGGRGLDWGDDGYLYVVARNNAPVSRIAENGGSLDDVTKLNPGETSQRWPQRVPGSPWLLFSSNRIATDWDQANVEAQSLKTGERKVLVRGAYFGRYLPSGHLVYVHDGQLYAVRVDRDRMELKGAASPVIRDLASHGPSGGGRFDFSQTGLFVYAAGKGDSTHYPFGWMREGGKLEPLPVPEAPYSTPRISPDGSQLVVTNMTNEDVWVYEFGRGTFTRVTSNGNGNIYAIWAPDGKHIVWGSNAADGYSLWWARADGAGTPVELLRRKERISASSFSPDGRNLAVFTTFSSTGIEVLHLDRSDPERPKIAGSEGWHRGRGPMYSPDGRWMLYLLAQGGNPELYVEAAPGSGGSGRWVISTGGAQAAQWAPSGRRIFFTSPDNHLMTADYTVTGDRFVPGAPRRWSETAIGNATGSHNFDVAPDGKRILATPTAESAQALGNLHLTFVFHFFDELKRRLP
jgi:Tol biopolymer transport system component